MTFYAVKLKLHLVQLDNNPQQIYNKFTAVQQIELPESELNPFNASCSKLLLFEGISAILV